MAKRWNKAVDLYIKNRNEFILVKYEDFISDKTNYINNLAERLGLKVTNDISQIVDVPYNRVGNHEVTGVAFFWKN